MPAPLEPKGPAARAADETAARIAATESDVDSANIEAAAVANTAGRAVGTADEETASAQLDQTPRPWPH